MNKLLMYLSEIHWGSIFPSALLYGMFCGIWHRPFFFGKKWDDAMGFKKPVGWVDPPIQYVVPLISSLITTVATAIILELLKPESFNEALLIGLLLGLGFGLPIVFTVGTIPIIHKPLQFGRITGVAQAIGILIMTLFLYYLSHWIEND